jgi:hypothetical protein
MPLGFWRGRARAPALDLLSLFVRRQLGGGRAKVKCRALASSSPGAGSGSLLNAGPFCCDISMLVEWNNEAYSLSGRLR